MSDKDSFITDPFTIQDGLAIYQSGVGEPLLLFPYPHGSTLRPMAAGALAAHLVGLGRRVITFDPPGAFRSTRPLQGEMAEMLDCAEETLGICSISGPIDVVGHSMGGLCALGFAIEKPERVRRLLLIGACSGFPAVFRWSVPHNWCWYRDRAWWQCMGWGFRKMIGWDNLALHKRLDNLVISASYVDRRHIELWDIKPGDKKHPPPLRSVWLRTVRQVDYRPRLDEVQAPTLLCVGRHDPQTPPICSEELAAGIPDADLILFEESGHSPFIEEPQSFLIVASRFFDNTSD